MSCREGPDPADFDSGFLDPIDDPTPPTSEISVLPAKAVLESNGQAWVRFQITLSDIDYINDITVQYVTTAATAVAGTDYTAVSGTLTILSGNNSGEIPVQVILTPQRSYNVFFYMGLSSPTHATLGTSPSKGTIDFSLLYGSGGGGGGGGGGDPVNASSYTAWDLPGVLYRQFQDCGYQDACTGFASAAIMSALYFRQKGRDARFDAKRLFRDAGGKVCGGPDCNTATCNCTTCSRFSLSTVLSYVKANGAHLIDADPKVIPGGTNYRCESRSPDTGLYKIGTFVEMGGADLTMAQVIKRVKQALVDNGVVGFASPWYSNWNTIPDSDIIRPPGADSGLGHAWIITGWNDTTGNGGSFQLQSSHGCNWGKDGRAWMPYSYMKPKWSYRAVTWGGAA